MGRRRVVVTGLGMVSPLGNDVTQSWQGIRAGQTGVSQITYFDASAYNCQIAAEVKDFDITQLMPAKEARRIDEFLHYALAAAAEAMADADIVISDKDKYRAGVAIGSGIGGVKNIENATAMVKQGNHRKISPFFIPGTVINMASGHVAIKYNCAGPNFSITTACTTGTHNIGYAARTIAYGDADLMIAGGAEQAITECSMVGFMVARALSTRNQDPESASRPWDKGRDGFVMGCGAGVMVLEELTHAQARGATIYAELTGFGMSDDAHHITAPPATGEGAAVSMINAIRDAELAPQQIHYINAHGTSTQAGDLAETNAIKQVFADHAYRLPVSSTKSMTGHLLGAAGAVEAIFSILALRDQLVPPTINLQEPDEGCDLDYVPQEARQASLEHVLSNSFGFGGTNGTLIFSRYQD